MILPWAKPIAQTHSHFTAYYSYLLLHCRHVNSVLLPNNGLLLGMILWFGQFCFSHASYLDQVVACTKLTGWADWLGSAGVQRGDWLECPYFSFFLMFLRGWIQRLHGLLKFSLMSCLESFPLLHLIEEILGSMQNGV